MNETTGWIIFFTCVMNFLVCVAVCITVYNLAEIKIDHEAPIIKANK